MSAPVLELAGVSKRYVAGASLGARLGGGGRTVQAVSDVSLRVGPGETLGLVGESGCGKSTLARLMLRLEDVSEGDILFEDRNVTHATARDLTWFRRRAQIVFQDPQSSLNRSHRIVRILASPLRLHRGLRRAGAIRAAARDLLALVGLDETFLDRFPHELSGGQRQRVGVARALAVEPRLIVLDEPVSALDVSIQAQLLNLLTSLQERLGVSYVMISHDLGVVRYVADRVAVMYLGRIVETGPTEEVFAAPRHPYTRLLLAAAGLVAPDAGALDGEPPSPITPPPGCAFHPRCPRTRDICRRDRPEPRPLGDAVVACHVAAE